MWKSRLAVGLVPMLVLVVVLHGEVVEGKPGGNSLFGGILPESVPDVRTNFDLDKITDVVTGKRDVSINLTKDGGLEVVAGLTDEEKIIYASVGLAAVVLTICCCVCCCRACCGSNKRPPTTNIVYQQLTTPQSNSHSVPISSVSSDAAKWT